jgi:serine/threonine protein kinase
MDAAVVKQLRRVRTLGRGASGAVVWLASDDASGQLLAVKSAAAGATAAQLEREGSVLTGLCSPHIIPCLGTRAAEHGGYQLLLEFAPGGSLADEAARSQGGRLPEPAIRAYAGDVARALEYLHARSLVHGDVKARNVVIGADGRARLTDFGCARRAADDDDGSALLPIGGTPAFMAPEVARGEEQGPAADVWALGCTVVEMATGCAPWSDMNDLFAAVHRIGYTAAVPEVPGWLSAEAKDFLDGCFRRRAGDRSTAAQLLDHPFVASADYRAQPVKQEWASPRSTLHDNALWDSDTDEDEEEITTTPSERIGALACTASALPDWDSDEGWIHVLGNGEVTGVHDSSPADAGCFDWAEASEAECEPFAVAAADGSNGIMPYAVVLIDGASIWQDGCLSPAHLGSCRYQSLQPFDPDGNEIVSFEHECNRDKVMKLIFAQTFPVSDQPYVFFLHKPYGTLPVIFLCVSHSIYGHSFQIYGPITWPDYCLLKIKIKLLQATR